MDSSFIVTKSLLENKLIELGLTRNMKIEVHSSLSSFGHVEGGATTIITTLKEITTENGSIVMSSFLMSPQLPLDDLDLKRGLTCKIRILSPDDDEKSGMGIISDTFRKMPGVITGEGTFRSSAWGMEKEINCQGYNNLIANGGYALLLGVDIYRLTSMHYMESNMPEKITNIFKPLDDIIKYYPTDQWFIETGNPPVKAWYKIQEEAYSRGYIKDIIIGKSKCMFFKIKDVVSLYKNALDTDPLGLYGISEQTSLFS